MAVRTRRTGGSGADLKLLAGDVEHARGCAGGDEEAGVGDALAVGEGDGLGGRVEFKGLDARQELDLLLGKELGLAEQNALRAAAHALAELGAVVGQVHLLGYQQHAPVVPVGPQRLRRGQTGRAGAQDDERRGRVDGLGERPREPLVCGRPGR